jgi:hypothetical protein
MGTPPNTSIVLTPAELAFIADEFDGSPSAAIHEALGNLMADKSRDEYDDEMVNERYAAFETAKARRGIWAVIFAVETRQYMVCRVEREDHPNIVGDHYSIDKFPGGNVDLCRIYNNGSLVVGAMIYNKIIFVDKID